MIKEGRTSRKRFTAEYAVIAGSGCEAIPGGRQVGQTCRDMGITEQTYYRWRKEYGGMKTVQAKRLKDLERENGHLKKVVAELTLDKLILKEALEGNY